MGGKCPLAPLENPIARGSVISVSLHILSLSTHPKFDSQTINIRVYILFRFISSSNPDTITTFAKVATLSLSLVRVWGSASGFRFHIKSYCLTCAFRVSFASSSLLILVPSPLNSSFKYFFCFFLPKYLLPFWVSHITFFTPPLYINFLNVRNRVYSTKLMAS